MSRNQFAVILATATLVLVRSGHVDTEEWSVHDDVMESDVEFVPVFLPTPRNVTVSLGERAVLRCRVENLGTRTVTWKRFEEVHPLTIGLFPFAPDTRIHVDYNQRMNEWSLIIQDIRPSDEGVYQCQISTKNDHESYNIVMHVRTVRISGREYVERGETIRLECNASGRSNPPHDLHWLRDDRPIKSDPTSGTLVAKKIDSNYLLSVLTIERSQFSDAGEYVCVTSNNDAAVVNVHVLRASPSVGKRGTLYDKMVSRSSAARVTLWSPTFVVSWTVVVVADVIVTSLTSRRRHSHHHQHIRLCSHR